MEESPSFWRPILDELAKNDIKLLVTLPETFLAGFWPLIEKDKRFIHQRVTKEDQGIGICAGAYCGGLKSALLMANAGFMLTGYVTPTLSGYYRLPVFMLVSHRGIPGDHAYFQEYQGLHTVPLMDAMGVQHFSLDTPDKLGLITDAFQYSQLYRRPVAVLLPPKLLKE